MSEVRAKQRQGRDVPLSQLFANHGRPRVAVIGSGAGGAVAAARLAATCDVAVFEAGPSFTPARTPARRDGRHGAAVTRRSDDLSPGLQRPDALGRLVGGGTVLTSGMSIRCLSTRRSRSRRHARCARRGGAALSPGPAERGARLRSRPHVARPERAAEPGVDVRRAALEHGHARVPARRRPARQFSANFFEVLGSPIRKDAHTFRSLLGVAFPGRFGELSVYLALTVGAGKGLLITVDDTEFGGGLRYSPFRP